jgi:hypothetical protein
MPVTSGGALLPCPDLRATVRVGLILILGTVTACGGPAPAPDGGTGEVGTVTMTPTVATSAPTPVATPSPATGPGVGCPQLRDLPVGTAAVPLADFEPGPVTLAGGTYSGGGATITLLDPCAFGDLNGDGSADAIGAVEINAGGTGHFYSLVVWLRSGGAFELETSLALGDRNPVREITGVSAGVVTVVYLTRTDDQPMAALNVKRTATYELTPAGLAETGHTDAPYNPLIDG